MALARGQGARAQALIRLEGNERGGTYTVKAHTPRILAYVGSLGLLCGGATLTGCAGGKPPTAALAQAEQAVQHASSRSDAPRYAPAELQKARDQLETAQRAMQAEDYERARRQAESALVNAQLAEAKAEAEETRQAASALQQSIQSLRQEAQRNLSTR